MYDFDPREKPELDRTELGPEWAHASQGAVDTFVNDVCDYLDELRESGVTNMWGASSYVEDEFGVGRKPAIALCMEWQRTFPRKKS